MTAIGRLLDDFSRRRRPLRSLGASGQLGYGIPTPAFEAGLARAPDMIGVDMGSIDIGPAYLGQRQDGADPRRSQARLAQSAARGAATGHSPDRRLGGFGWCQAASRSDAGHHSRDRARGRARIPHGRGRLGRSASGGEAGDRRRARAADGYHAATDRDGCRRGLPHRRAARARGVPARAGGGRGCGRARSRLRHGHFRQHPGHAGLPAGHLDAYGQDHRVRVPVLRARRARHHPRRSRRRRLRA